jgi:hypothetical protein
VTDPIHRVVVTMFNTTFNNISVGVRVIGGGNRKYQEKTTDLIFSVHGA